MTTISPDRIRQILTDELPSRVLLNEKVRNAINQGDRQNLMAELGPALQALILGGYRDQNELLKQFMDNENFRRLVTDRIFDVTFTTPQQPGLIGPG